MNKIKSTVISLFLISGAFSVFGQTFSQENKDSIASGFNKFSTELLYTVPANAVQLNTWQDSFIGMMWPSMRTHLGTGISFGVSRISTVGLQEATTAISAAHQELLPAIKTNYSLAEDTKYTSMNFGYIPDAYVLPTASADIRFGGMWLPIDWGFSFAMSNAKLFELDFENFDKVNYAAKNLNFESARFASCFDMIDFGSDFRIRLTKEKLVCPSITFGGGYHFSRGAFYLYSKNQSELSGPSLTQSTYSDVNVAYTGHLGFAQLQMSKHYRFASIYLGARGIVTKQENAWNYTYTNELSDNSTETPTVLETSTESDWQTVSSGQEPVKGFIHGTFDFPGVEAQVYGGMGLNLGPVQLGVGISYEIRHNIFGANLALHLKS